MPVARRSRARVAARAAPRQLRSVNGRRAENYNRAIDEASDDTYELRRVGRVESSLEDVRVAPKQGGEGAPDAWLVFHPEMTDAMRDLRPGDEVFVLTWLHRARRDVLRVHPRGDRANPERGVFSTRSPDRPNPIGLHRVEIAAIEGARVRVRNLEVIHGTPVVDVKPVLRSDGSG